MNQFLIGILIGYAVIAVGQVLIVAADKISDWRFQRRWDEDNRKINAVIKEQARKIAALDALLDKCNCGPECHSCEALGVCAFAHQPSFKRSFDEFKKRGAK